MTADQGLPAPRRPLQRALLGAVGFYQRAISPTRPPRCRFVPSCSAYAVEAIEVHGAVRGSWLAVRRLAKCAPWHPGGVDLVPPQAPGRRPGTPSGTAQHVQSSNSAAQTPVAAASSPRSAVSSADGARTTVARHSAGLRPGPAAGGLRCSE